MSPCENSCVVGNTDLKVIMKEFHVFILVSVLCSLVWYLCTELDSDNLLVKQCDRCSEVVFCPFLQKLGFLWSLLFSLLVQTWWPSMLMQNTCFCNQDRPTSNQ